MPSFNGNAALFGAVLTWEFDPEEVARQQNTYAQLAGVEELTMGQRGAHTTVTGWLRGNDPVDLKAIKKVWWSYYDGNAYLLIDREGDGWPNVKLESVRFPPKALSQADGSSWQRYEARFFHQTNS